MTESKTKSVVRKRSTAKPKTKEHVLKLPTADDIEQARIRRRKAQERLSDPVGTIYGLPDGWVGAVIDSGLPVGRIDRIRNQWKEKGWHELEGRHSVSGYGAKAIVFVKTQKDYDNARDERAKRIEALRKSGQMH